MSVVVTHNAGFFSCCSIKLDNIIIYINKHSKIPDYVDSSQQFEWYKNESKDITYEYFEHYDSIDTLISFPVDYYQSHQYTNYSELDYAMICPVVKKYFSPSKQIITILNYWNKNMGWIMTIFVSYFTEEMIK